MHTFIFQRRDKGTEGFTQSSHVPAPTETVIIGSGETRGPSGGAIAGIVLGVTCGLLVALCLLCAGWKYYRRPKQVTSQRALGVQTSFVPTLTNMLELAKDDEYIPPNLKRYDQGLAEGQLECGGWSVQGRYTLVAPNGQLAWGTMGNASAKVACKAPVQTSRHGGSIGQEASILLRLHSNHIAHAVGLAPDMLVMEAMGDGDMHSLITRCDERLHPLEDILLLCGLQMAKALACLRREGVVHRNVTAASVLVRITQGDFCFKLGGFGLAVAEPTVCQQLDVTVEGMPVRWWAPESVQHGVYAGPSDVYMLGTLLWELASGAQPPYHPMLQEEAVAAIRQGQRLEQPVHMPQVLWPLVEACWKRPEQRPVPSDLVVAMARLFVTHARTAQTWARQRPRWRAKQNIAVLASMPTSPKYGIKTSLLPTSTIASL